MALIKKSYVCLQITLANGNQNYDLSELAAAIDAQTPRSAMRLVITADSGNASPVLIGDDLLSPTRFAFSLAAGIAAPTYQSYAQNVPWGYIHARSVGVGQKVNLEIMAA